ncbi:MAG TPA: protein kinase [Vicinamibacterales bacterium]|nr:protein kinase [Vicinamibacterales bacterium]
MIGQNVGKYRILDRIGKGGMGTVYKAVDETLHREVAIKVLNAELNDPEVAKRFRSEAITVARLSHPGIATIYELFEHEGQWLMVMEFVRGETLENMVARMGPLSAQRAAEFCMQALAALAHAHSMGVVHRDLKPANLMVTENGAVKVMDFGIARVSGGEQLTNAGFMMGTPSYMAPEQVRGGDIDARTDLYAMGVVFYRLCTAKLPFKGDTAFAMVQSQVNDTPTPVSTVRHDLPSWVEDIITRSLAKAPVERFQSAAEFHEGFARCLAGLPLASMYAGMMEPGMTPPRPMPTGSFARPMPTPSSTPYQMTGQMTASNMTVLAPGTNPGAISAASDPTVLTPAMGQATGRLAGTTPPAATQPLAAQAPAPSPKSGSGTTMWLVGGVAALALAGIGYAMFGRNSGAQPPASPPAGDQAALTTPAPPLPPSTSEQPAATPLPAAGTPNSSPVPTPGPALSGTAKPTPSPGTARAGAPGTTPTPATTPGATGRAGDAAADAVLATFSNVKFFAVVNGKRTNDRDVALNFLNGQVSVMPRQGGQPIVTVPYRKILKATYSLGRDPKWDETLPGPPPGLDVGTFMRQTRHWLVVQGAESYAVLRLDDSNFRQVLETFEQRSGAKVDRRK